MKIIVFSDSHRRTEEMQSVIERTYRTTDYYIHLGDGVNEFEILKERYGSNCVFLKVSGNTDITGMNVDRDLVIDFKNYKFFITHGHNYEVKSSKLSVLKNAGTARGANVILFGHTHAQYYKYESGIYLFNPGSVSQPRDGKGMSFGVIEIKNGIIFSHGKP